LLTPGGVIWNGEISEDTEGMPALTSVGASVKEDIGVLV
jgi:hypothetical protein